MRFSRMIVGVVVAVVCGVMSGTVEARDWFVRAGASGDGAQASPLGDPYEALEKCEAEDVIHVARGRYTGKLQSGQWNVPFDGIEVRGGYNDDFTARDPWKYPTMLVWDRASKNKPSDERVVVAGRGVVIDGLVIDEREQNEYDDTGRTPKDLDHADAAIRFNLPGTVRNCVLVNTSQEGVVCPVGTVVENNLFLNTFRFALKVNSVAAGSVDAKTPAVVKGNTFLWVWDDRAPGTGHDVGSAIYLSGPANISGNIFGHCDNNAIYSALATEKTSITNNVFFGNLWSNFKLFVDGQGVIVDDKTMDLFEEAGLKGSEGNVAKNPGMALDKGWMEATLKRTADEPGKVDMNEWNQIRQALGMDLQGTGGKAASGIAPAYPLEKVMALMVPKDAGVKAGARVVGLEVKFSGGVAGPAKTYEKAELARWAGRPEGADGKALEMTVAVSTVANIGGIPGTYKADDHEGVYLHDPTGEVRVTGFYRKGSAVNRMVNEVAGNYSGSGKPDRLYTVKGVACVVRSIPKAGFYIESMVPLEAGAMARKRAVGRDWFVRAGAQGGDGTKEKPFRDPYQALEKVEAGDFVHVAGGEYVGKLHGGMWKVSMADVSMLGGYDKDFAARDPWKNPTVLYCPEDFKGSRGGYTLQGDGDHSGFVLDGFVFDKRFNNKYNEKGDLLVEESDKTEHVWLSRPGCVVRNCVFMNGAAGAVRLTTAQTVENCIFLNHYGKVVTVEDGFTPRVPIVFKNNTLAFAWEERFGSGHGIMADLLILNGGTTAVVDNNIFEFADQHAIRLAADPKDVELTNNVFAHNLWAEVYRPNEDTVVDNKNFGDLAQMGFKVCSGNVMMIPMLPLEKKWFDVYLNRTAYVQGKVENSDWNQMREILGEPPIATGGKSSEGRAPAYDRALAMTLFPGNPACKAGARAVALEVKFSGVVKAKEEHEYQEVAWDVAKDLDAWNKLDGKRVAMKVAIQQVDNQWLLDDVKKEQYASWKVGGPQGIDSGGLPMRVYVPVGTKAERMFNGAKGYSAGAPEETHVIKGVVRSPRQMVVEEVEKGE